MIVIRKSNQNDKLNIEKLRELSYNESKFLTAIDDTYNKWDSEDEKSIIFVLEKDNNILATARTKIIRNSKDLKKRNRILNTSLSYPILLVDKTATNTKFQGIGLNTLIRYKIITFAKELNLNAVVGLVSKNSPRYNSMVKYGYESRPALLTNNFFKYIISETQLMLLILSKNNFNVALYRIRNSDAFKSYH